MPHTPIARIKDLSAEDRTVLANHQLTSTEQIWTALAKDEGLLDTLGLQDAAKTRVRAALAAQAIKESTKFTKRRFIDHVPDVIFAAFVSVAILALLYVNRSPQQVTVVVAAKPLPPFHLIDATDIEVHHAADDSGAKRAANLYIGRYSKAQIRVGEMLDSAKLSSGMRLTDELNGLRIFTVKIRPTALLTGLPPPFKLDLLLSPHSQDDRGRARMFTVYVLDLRSEGDSLVAVVAATEDSSATLLSALSTGDLIAVGPAR